MTIADQWWAEYLTDRALGFEFEPDLGTSAPLDFAVHARSGRVVAEVKQFETRAQTKKLWASPDRTAAFGAKEMYGSVRRRVKDAAKQLKPLVGTGQPLVIVLANPFGADVSLTPEDTLAALYGDLTIPISANPAGGVSSSGEISLGRDGALRGKHAHISAVVTLHRPNRDLVERVDGRWHYLPGMSPLDALRSRANPDRDFLFVRVYVNPSAVAAPLPDDLFAGPDDELWGPDEHWPPRSLGLLRAPQGRAATGEIGLEAILY